MRHVAVCMIVLVAAGAPAAWASDLTDAIVDVDPRIRRQSGQGAALGSIYDRQADEAPGALERDEEDLPPEYSGYYEGLRSPLVGSDAEAQPELGPLPPHDRLGLPDDDALGYPEAREGVWYQDDLTGAP